MLRPFFSWLQDRSVEKVAILFAIAEGKKSEFLSFCTRVAAGFLPRDDLLAFFCDRAHWPLEVSFFYYRLHGVNTCGILSCSVDLSSMFTRQGNLKQCLISQGVKTVGDMAKLTEPDIDLLPIQVPKLSTTLKAFKKSGATKNPPKPKGKMFYYWCYFNYGGHGSLSLSTTRIHRFVRLWQTWLD